MTTFNPNLGSSKEPNERGVNPTKRKGYQPTQMLEREGLANRYGACQSCGKPLEFWFIYKLCDRCLTIPSYAVQKL